MSSWFLLVLFLSIGLAESVPPAQEFIRQPHDQTAKVGDHVTLPCRVKNKRGMLQWTRDGFGLGVERNLTGFDRYHMSGIDEEGKTIHQLLIWVFTRQNKLWHKTVYSFFLEMKNVTLASQFEFLSGCASVKFEEIFSERKTRPHGR